MTLVQFEAQRAIQPFKQSHQHQRTEFLEQPLFQLSGHSGVVNDCRFSPDGKTLASCAGEVILWSVTSSVASLGALRPHKSPITSISWSIDGLKFATGSADKTVAVQDTITGKVERRFKCHKEIVNTVCFSREEPNVIVSGDDAGFIVASDIRMPGPIAKKKSNSPVTSISICGQKIAVGGVCGSIFIDVISGSLFKMQQRLACDSIVFGTAIDPMGRYLAANDANAHMYIFNILAFAERDDRLIAKVENGVMNKEIIPPRTAWSPDGRYIMCGSTDKMLRIWDVESIANPVLQYELPGHKGTVTGCDFHPQYPIIVSASTDGTVIIGELGK